MGEKVAWLVPHLVFVAVLCSLLALIKDPIQLLIGITSVSAVWISTLLCLLLDELEELLGKGVLHHVRRD